MLRAFQNDSIRAACSGFLSALVLLFSAVAKNPDLHERICSHVSSGVLNRDQEKDGGNPDPRNIPLNCVIALLSTEGGEAEQSPLPVASRQPGLSGSLASPREFAPKQSCTTLYLARAPPIA